MPPSSSTSYLVLVADDEPSMLELVVRHLQANKDHKYDIIQASDGEDAWRLAQERLPDLVVLDVMMPGMSGWEVCRKIRDEVALAHTGVVMLTGIGENLNQMTSPLYGADAYIDKPFDFPELDAKVELALRARATLRGTITRPHVNGVAGPAKVAREATRAAKAAPKKSPAPAKKAAPKKKAVAKKAAPKKAAAKKAAPKKKVVAKKAAPKKGASKKKAASAKKPGHKKPAAKKAPAKKKAAKKIAKKKRR